MQNGLKRVIAYASRSLSKSEQHYPAHKLEFLALKWALCDKCHDYLYGNTFTVITDNNPLTYVLTTANLDATGHRWLAAFGVYNFEIIYRPGMRTVYQDYQHHKILITYQHIPSNPYAIKYPSHILKPSPVINVPYTQLK